MFNSCTCLCGVSEHEAAIPSLSLQVAQRVLELLKVFNSRTCQLVLGAGAMQVGFCCTNTCRLAQSSAQLG